MRDYEQNPIQGGEPEKQSNDSKVMPGTTLIELLSKLPAHEKDSMNYLINSMGYPLADFYKLLDLLRKHKGSIESVIAEL